MALSAQIGYIMPYK